MSENPDHGASLAAALVSIGVAHVAAAQSLGDVARKEEERRKAVKSSGKVYTNDKLKPAPQPSAPPTGSSGQASTHVTVDGSGSPDPAPSDAASAKGDENSWRKRIADARESLQRSQTFADALQNQLNSLRPTS